MDRTRTLGTRGRAWSGRAVGAGLVVLIGCASGSGGVDGASRTSDVITAAEIAGSEALTAYDLVQQLRPRFLRPAGSADPVVVYVDGVRRGGVYELRSLDRSMLSEVRYVNSTDATMMYGTGHRSGAIQVKTKR